MPTDHVVVLGAGLQGVCAALELERRGYRVTLVEQAPNCLLRASLRNEGKIHLGFVYANDPSFRTSDLMLRSALAFAPEVERLLGAPVAWDALKSRPFTYVIARESLVSPACILDNYTRLGDRCAEVLRESEMHYLGERPDQLWRQTSSSPLERAVSAEFAWGFVETREAALDLPRFCALLRSALNATAVRKLYRHKVRSVERTPRGFKIEGSDAEGQTWRDKAAAVVNCLWEGRLALDEGMGVLPRRKWVYRLKYRLLGQLPPALADLPSLTLVLGRYGDVVVNPPERAYISWYPACMRGWSADLAAPAAWQDACNGRVAPAFASEIAREALSQFDAIIPGLKDSQIDVVDAGIIFSWGQSDIDDAASELHARHEIGVHAHDGYFSIDTGKLTCAPLFARQLGGHFS